MRISLAGCSTTGPCALPGRIIGRDCCSSAGGSFSLWIAMARIVPRRRGGGPRPGPIGGLVLGASAVAGVDHAAASMASIVTVAPVVEDEGQAGVEAAAASALRRA